MDSLCYLSAKEMNVGIVSGEFSARELCDAHLARIEKLNSQLGAFLCVDGEGARAAADAVDTARARGESLGPMAGVPVGVKDGIVTKGLTTTAGSKILEGWVPPYDATVCKRLREAGAIILGKLNMDEFAMGSSNENSAFGVCRNPWDLERVPGGSSGGSAAAVAAGLCAIALGSDTGGSIRQPAAFCGVVGIKPTYGFVSRYGLIAYASSLDQIGPLARHGEDLAIALEVICGHDSMDATSTTSKIPQYSDSLDASVKGLRIGIAETLSPKLADDDVRIPIESAIEVLKEKGATVEEVGLPHVHQSLAAYYLIAPAEASSNLARFDGVRYGQRVDDGDLNAMISSSRSNGFGPEVIRRIMLGTFALRSGYVDQYYNKANALRELIRQDFEKAFKSVDVILSPTTPTTAFKIGEVSSPEDMYKADIFTLACNLAGLPGLSVPCGLTPQNLPVGLQCMANASNEQVLLNIAHAIESSREKIPVVPKGIA